MSKERTNKGTFKKGVSGNPKGRPKKVDLAQKYLAEKNEEIGDDALKALAGLLAKYVAEGNEKGVLEVGKIIIGYQKPRISSIESADSKPTKIEVAWSDPEEIPEDHPMYRLTRPEED